MWNEIWNFGWITPLWSVLHCSVLDAHFPEDIVLRMCWSFDSKWSAWKIWCRVVCFVCRLQVFNVNSFTPSHHNTWRDGTSVKFTAVHCTVYIVLCILGISTVGHLKLQKVRCEMKNVEKEKIERDDPVKIQLEFSSGFSPVRIFSRSHSVFLSQWPHNTALQFSRESRSNQPDQKERVCYRISNGLDWIFPCRF